MDEILSGWEQAMEGQDSVQWLADRLKAAGVADRAWAGEPS
jgi:hypothetical protein